MKKTGYHKLLMVMCILISVMLMVASCTASNSDSTDSGSSSQGSNTESGTESESESSTEPANPSYTVTVVDENNVALEGATVQLCVGDRCLLPVLTDANGVAVVEVFAEDEYSVKVSLTGYTGEDAYYFETSSKELTVQLTALPAGATASNPLWFEGIENNSITLAAGTTVYYTARVGGTTMTLNGSNVTVEHNGTTYTEQNGVVTLQAVAASFYEPPVFAITNTGSTEETYTVSFAYPLGNMENPATLTVGENTASIAADSQGYFYTWTADAAGTLTITMSGSNWTYVINNMTTYAYGNNYASNDDTVVASDSVIVAAGDVIQVVIGTADHQAADVTFTVAFA